MVDPPRSVWPEIKAASQEGIVKLLQAVDKSRYRMPILIALATGTSRREVLALKWEDLDRTAKTLSFRPALSQLTAANVIVEEAKTGKSRTVAIHGAMVQGLVKHPEHQAWLKANLASEYHDEGWVCAKTDGIRMTPSLVSKEFKRLAGLVGVDVAFHGLRRTQAAGLIMSGVPVKVVSERLGHSNTTITQDVYSHVLPHMQEHAANIIGKIMDARDGEAAG
jgi:integrase